MNVYLAIKPGSVNNYLQCLYKMRNVTFIIHSFEQMGLLYFLSVFNYVFMQISNNQYWEFSILPFLSQSKKAVTATHIIMIATRGSIHWIDCNDL